MKILSSFAHPEVNSMSFFLVKMFWRMCVTNQFLVPVVFFPLWVNWPCNRAFSSVPCFVCSCPSAAVLGMWFKGIALPLMGKSSVGLRHGDVSAGVFSWRGQRQPYLCGSASGAARAVLWSGQSPASPDFNAHLSVTHDAEMPRGISL